MQSVAVILVPYWGMELALAFGYRPASLCILWRASTTTQHQSQLHRPCSSQGLKISPQVSYGLGKRRKG
jgi:hypothetical protein